MFKELLTIVLVYWLHANKQYVTIHVTYITYILHTYITYILYSIFIFIYIFPVFVFSVQRSCKTWKPGVGGHSFHHPIKAPLRVKTGASDNGTGKQARTDCQANVRSMWLLSHTKASSLLILCSLFLSKFHLKNPLFIL